MNFKHLYYFWMTARTGGVIRAGQRLHLTPQTLSGQIKLLEERLGCRLFERQGRNIRLTDAGQIAVGYAEDIFLLGSQLEGALKGRASTGGATAFKVGIADSIPKSIAFHLLQPAVVDGPPARIICREGGLPALLGDLAVQRLDLVHRCRPNPMSRPSVIDSADPASRSLAPIVFIAEAKHRSPPASTDCRC
jgi:LysR family transcriptional activator of nhaA